MCGICGIFDLKGRSVGRDLLNRMTSALQHRGPDGAGSYVSEGIGLGHRRLSIIDIKGGAQPITNEDGSLHLVFNGEIYNFIELRGELEQAGHVFQTRSDTEVIVHAYEEWGLDCVKLFNGIFAFALWDQKQKRLVLARDHLGVKPLYYSVVGDRLLFASEIKSLLADPQCCREVDIPALGQLFTLRYVPSPETLFRGIKKLPPAHLMVVHTSGLEVKRFWNWKPEILTGNPDERLLTEAYQSLVEDAIRLQMRSDVPVGLFLSSGIDSGTLLALMSKYSDKPIYTFTIGFEHGERSNETEDAREMARRFGADHSEMIVGPKDYEKYYERYLWDLEEPVGNETAAAFYFVSLIASRKVKVALTGQGADEPWAGYDRYLGVKLSEIYSRLPLFLTRGLLGRLERFAKNERWKRGLQSLYERDILTRFVKIYSFYSSPMKAKLFQPWVKQEISPDGYEARRALQRLQAEVEHLDPLTQILYLDTRTNLPDDLLMVADKTSMANSIEARVPFLDYRLVEFVETLPPNLRLRGFQGKYLHKKAVGKWLPRKVVYQKKKGFENPVDEWLRARMRHYIGDCLLSERAAVHRYFEKDCLREIIAQHEANQQNYMRHIYLLISFELWHQKFIPA